MLLAVESNLLSHNFLMELIDKGLTDCFFDYPILLELSLSNSREQFIDIINNSQIDKFKVDFNKLLGCACPL